MGTYIKIDGDPNRVAATGVALRAMAEALHGQLQAPLAEINAIDGERPWGTDHFGDGFEATYDYVPDGSEEKLRDSIRNGMSNAGEGLGRVGGATVLAMTEIQGGDSQSASDIRTAVDQ